MHTSKVLLLLAAIACVPARANFSVVTFTEFGGTASVTTSPLFTTVYLTGTPGDACRNPPCPSASAWIQFQDDWTITGGQGSGTMLLPYVGASLEIPYSGPPHAFLIPFLFGTTFDFHWIYTPSTDQRGGGSVAFGPPTLYDSSGNSVLGMINSRDYGNLFGVGASAVEAPEPTGMIWLALIGAWLYRRALTYRSAQSHC